MNETARFQQVFEVDDRNAAQGLDRLEKRSLMATGAVNKVSGALKGLAGLAAAGITFHELRDLARDGAEAVRQLREISLAMGVTVTQADAMRQVFGSAGVELQSINDFISEYGANLAEVKRLKPGEELTGAAKAWEPFLGMEAPDAFLAVAQHIKSIGDEGARLAAVNELLGETGFELLPVLMQSEEVLSRIKSGMGGMSAEMAEGLERTRANLVAADEKWRSIRMQLAGHITPELTELAVELMPALEASANAFGEALGFVAEHAKEIAVAIGTASAAWAGMKGLAGLRALGAAGAAGIIPGKGAFGSPTLLGLQALLSKGGGALGGLLKGAGGLAMRFAPGLALGGAVYGAGRAIYQGATDDRTGVQKLLGRSQSRDLSVGGLLEGVAIDFQRTVDDMEAAKAREVQAALDTESALKGFEMWTGFSSDRLKALGFDLQTFAGQVKAGGNAMSRMYRRAMMADAAKKTGVDNFRADELQRALLYAGPLVKRSRASGVPVGDIASADMGLIRNAIRDVEAGRGPGGKVLERLGLGSGVTVEELKDFGKGLKLGSALIQAKRAANRIADLDSLMDSLVKNGGIQQNINGPVNITLNQDLRGEDPDRIAIAVTDRLARLSEHRTQARTGPSPLVRR